MRSRALLSENCKHGDGQVVRSFENLFQSCKRVLSLKAVDRFFFKVGINDRRNQYLFVIDGENFMSFKSGDWQPIEIAAKNGTLGGIFLLGNSSYDVHKSAPGLPV